MTASDTPQKELGILVGVDDESVAEAMRMVLPSMFEYGSKLRISVRVNAKQIRAAATLYDFDLALLFINSMMLSNGYRNRYEAAAELIAELKATTRSAVIIFLTHQPPGFATRAEQAGADGIIELPYVPETLKQTITTALECRTNNEVAQQLLEERRQGRAKLRPRVVILDESTRDLGMVEVAVWDCWEHATIVACTDPNAAWQELQRTPPDLFITDLKMGGVSGSGILARVVEQEVQYPIVVLCDEPLKGEADTAGDLVGKLRLSYWPKRLKLDEFTEVLGGLLD